MKELSIEEKAKRYDEAIERARYWEKNPTVWSSDDICQKLFPELKENEDERIRKEIIRIVDIWTNSSPVVNGIPTKTLLAWLEKQEHDDNTEPKYKVGVWLVCGDYEPEQIIGIKTNAYEMSNGDIRPFHMIDNNHNIRLWTIQDAKDGDVLATEAFVFIFKAIREDKGVGYYCANENELYEGDDSTFHVAHQNSLMGSINNDFTHYTPATKEQRDLLFSKMHEAGYEWDAAKKELKKIEKKPAWSEEDESFYNYLLGELNASLIDYCGASLVDITKAIGWFKSIKDRFQTQTKQEWSEEDEEMCKEVLTDIIYAKNDLKAKECLGLSKRAMKAFNWFSKRYKSLRPQNTWKPSDEQMADLWNMVCECRPADQQLLQDIYYGLKTLRGE